MTHNRCIVDKDRRILKKYISLESFEYELSASSAAYSVAKASGLFYVPKILEYNSEELWVDFEYLPALIPLGQYVYSRNPQLLVLMEQAGVILSIIHKTLHLNKKKTLPGILNCDGQQVFIHGDFNLTNVQYDLFSKKIVVIDWALTPRANMVCNWGSPYFDIAWMVNSLFYDLPWLRFDYQFRTHLAKIFLESYKKSSIYTFSNDHLRNLGKKIYWLMLKTDLKQDRLIDFLLQIYNRNSLLYFLISLKKPMDNKIYE
jgi:hypothetical protein